MATRLKDEEIPAVPTISAAERLSDGLVIKFQNGQCGLFSAAYLFSKLSDCESLNEDHIEW